MFSSKNLIEIKGYLLGLGIITTIGGVIRIIFSFQIPGIIHPDEHYQALEIAHYLLYGYGEISWEWNVTNISPVRSILFPLHLAFIMGIGEIFKLSYPDILLMTRIWTALISTCLIPLTAHLSKLLTPDFLDTTLKNSIGLLSAIIIAFGEIYLKYSWHTFTNTFVLPVMAISLILLLEKYNSFYQLTIFSFAGGLFFVYSIILRPEILLLFLTFFLVFFKKCIAKNFLSWIIGAIIALIYNVAVENLYFGIGPFVTLINYFRFNIQEASFYGVIPAGYYTQIYIIDNYINLFTFILGILLVIYQIITTIMISMKLLPVITQLRYNHLLIRQIQLLTILLVNLLIWERIPHKEERFLLPWSIFLTLYMSYILGLFFRVFIVIMLKIKTNGPTLFQCRIDEHSKAVVLWPLFIVVISSSLMVQSLFMVTYIDLTPYAEIEQSMLDIGQTSDVRGVVIVFEYPQYTGTMAYLHRRDIPVLRISRFPYSPNQTFLIAEFFNYLVIPTSYHASFPFIFSELLLQNFDLEKIIPGNHQIEIWKRI